jgi:hypothetical protein
MAGVRTGPIWIGPVRSDRTRPAAGGGGVTGNAAPTAEARRSWPILALRARFWTRSGLGGGAQHGRTHLSAQESGLGFGSGFPTVEGGTGSRHRGELARAEGKEEGEGARHGPYHPRVLRRRLEAGDRWCRGGIGAALGKVDGGTAAQEHRGSWDRRWRLRGNARELSWLRRVG